MDKSDGVADDWTSHTPDGRGDEQECVGFRAGRSHLFNLQDFFKEGKEGRVSRHEVNVFIFDSGGKSGLDIGLGIADEVRNG